MQLDFVCSCFIAKYIECSKEPGQSKLLEIFVVNILMYSLELQGKKHLFLKKLFKSNGVNSKLSVNKVNLNTRLQESGNGIEVATLPQ